MADKEINLEFAQVSPKRVTTKRGNLDKIFDAPLTTEDQPWLASN
jgi:hypothetical protein